MNELLPLPDPFGANEWFFIVSLILLISLYIILPRKFPTSITVLLLIFGAVVARTFDEILAAPGHNMYNVLDSGAYELFDLISYPLYSLFCYLFVYIYVHFKLSGGRLVLYLLFFATFGAVYEKIAIYFNFFTFKEWKLIYSPSVYLFVQPLTLVFYHFIIGLHPSTNKTENV